MTDRMAGFTRRYTAAQHRHGTGTCPIERYDRTVLLHERFWKHVHKTAGCWEWTGTRSEGYGRLLVAKRWVPAHRLSWELARGPIPDGLCVLHRCDNPPCVKPAHLFLGTKADNNRDRATKGRSAVGVRNGRAKLTPELVEEIRGATHLSTRAAARVYGISKSHVHYLRSGRGWDR